VVTPSVPAAVGVMFVEHDAVPADPESVQLPLGVKVTVPEGVIRVPGDVSVTSIMHEVDWPTTTVDGEQLTVAVVVRGLTITLVLLELPLWVGSPP